MKNFAPNQIDEFLDLENNLARLVDDKQAQKNFLFEYIKKNIHDVSKLKRLCESFAMHVETDEEEKLYLSLRNEIIIDYLLQNDDKQKAAQDFLNLIFEQKIIDKADFETIYQIVNKGGIEDYAAAICEKIYPDEYDRANFIADNFKNWFSQQKLKIIRFFISSFKNSELVAGMARDARMQDSEGRLNNFNYLIFTFNRIPKDFEFLQPVLKNKKISESLKFSALEMIKNTYFSTRNLDEIKKIPTTSLFFFLTEIMQEDPQDFFSMLNDETRRQLGV